MRVTRIEPLKEKMTLELAEDDDKDVNKDVEMGDDKMIPIVGSVVEHASNTCAVGIVLLHLF